MRRPQPCLALFAICCAALSGLACGGGKPSVAADAYIEEAADAEEREGLTQARDDIDDEMRDLAVERDAEIERLRQENEDLRSRLAARRKK